jgi:hypothetical protein
MTTTTKSATASTATKTTIMTAMTMMMIMMTPDKTKPSLEIYINIRTVVCLTVFIITPSALARSFLCPYNCRVDCCITECA